ncbi:hypothetical protein SAMN05428967_1195 [Phyllobacterium sp. YR620]|uniref:hypothetical protein n=1 Tax=Phyllobacterium sp. YR620 TaxID=1881066 RepID=UPI000885CA73|nr:hypothetical protein [Phyllobacterium sp. YR620]SDP10045.1 hypothetical protein SAMN05428967_1195 [Phyllobacterium sp. YR620]
MKATRNESLEYIASLLQELADLAKDQKLPFLSYLIEMAFIEVSDLAKQQVSGKSKTQSDHLNGSEPH